MTPRDSRRGFTLVELLIGLLLGAIASAGALSAYASGRATYEHSQVLSRLNERAHYLLSSLTADLQLAGYFGLQAASALPIAAAVPASALTCGADLPTRLMPSVEINDGHYLLPCAPRAPGSVAGTDVLILRRASAQPAAPANGRLQVLTSLVRPGDSGIRWDGKLPPGMLLTPARSELRDLLVRIYYVAQAADGSDDETVWPALRVKSLTAVSGAPSFIDTEVMPGVEDFQVEALPDAQRLRALQVSVLLRADRADPRHTDETIYRYAGKTVAPRDHYHRLLVQQTIALRNPNQGTAHAP